MPGSEKSFSIHLFHIQNGFTNLYPVLSSFRLIFCLEIPVKELLSVFILASSLTKLSSCTIFGEKDERKGKRSIQ